RGGLAAGRPPGGDDFVESRIFIVGSGVVGAATGEGFAKAGHDATFIDINEARVEELKGRGWDARTEIDLTDEPESLIFLTLPTPNDGHRYDLTAFTAGTASAPPRAPRPPPPRPPPPPPAGPPPPPPAPPPAPASAGRAPRGAAPRHTVVVRSTVPPGTTEGLVKDTLEENSGLVANE